MIDAAAGLRESRFFVLAVRCSGEDVCVEGAK